MAVARILATRLAGLRAVVDVQHLYKHSNPADRGCLFHLKDGTHVWEAAAATLYAQALVCWLRARGAVVVTNNPVSGILVGDYPARNRFAGTWGAHCYLACHLDAGGGNYALVEYAAGTLGAALAAKIGLELGELHPNAAHRELGLTVGQRGHVCVGAVSRSVAAVILEPFFGDYAPAQSLLSPAGLVTVGETIGEGVAQWWEAR